MFMRPFGRLFDESGDGIFLAFHVGQELSMIRTVSNHHNRPKYSHNIVTIIWAGCGDLTLCVYMESSWPT